MSSAHVSSLQDRISQAAKVMKITEDQLWEHLSDLGINQKDDDALALLEAETTREGDARKVFCENAVAPYVPVARFLAGWAILKGRNYQVGVDMASGPDKSVVTIIESLRPINSLKDKELIEKYGPDASTEIYDELNRRSHGRPFIIFNEDNTIVDVEKTTNHLRIARRNETKSTHVISTPEGNKPVRVYCVGEFPMLWLEESPIHPEIILVNGYCEKCGNTWDGISMEDRVLVRIGVMVGLHYADHKLEVHNLIANIKKAGNAKFLLDIPDVKFKYDELKEQNQLPVLRRRTSASRDGKADPCFVRNRSY